MLLLAVKKTLRPKQRLLVAVSGGIDSVALLHALLSLKDTLKLSLVVAHVDHGFRTESKLDATFVKKITMQYKLPFATLRLGKLPKGENLEAWGRERRYEFFLNILKKRKLDYIVTAHHSDDVAETLLMRLFANKELAAPKRIDPRRKILRPLLSVSRKEIERYAKANKLKWREDESNLDESRLRNLVRKRTIPTLEKLYGKSLKSILVERAFATDEDLSALAHLAEEIAIKLRPKRARKLPTSRSIKGMIGNLSAALQWRVVESLLTKFVGFPLGRLHSKRALAVINGDHVRCELPSKLLLERSGGELFIHRKSL